MLIREHLASERMTVKRKRSWGIAAEDLEKHGGPDAWRHKSHYINVPNWNASKTVCRMRPVAVPGCNDR
jgi:hypothetical protein